ncbi:MAG: class I SAM-dependent methyltransferase [Candidatus Woesearchaeota archaeon]
MWETPIYKFTGEIKGEKQQIFIDVTGSAPNFSKPGKQLEGVFDSILKGLDPKKTKILDFGAAKLRNTLYLLKKGFTVYSCDFNDLFKRSNQANNYFNKAEKFPNFKKLVFPDEFIDFEEKFDVILLINVINIMPVPLERLCVLALCRDKIKENGRLLWYTQHGTYSDADAVTTLYDGIVTGKGRKYHMFYRDFERKEIHEILMSTGFSFSDSFKFPTSGSNQAYAFIADGPILVDKTLGLTELLKKGKKSKLEAVQRESRWSTKGKYKKSRKVTYKTKIPKRVEYVKEINILETYLKELSQLPAGKKHASRYHKLIFNILKLVFDNRLKKPKMEESLAGSTKFVDITFKNPRIEGFFKDLAEGYRFICPNIFIECKNYNHDISNPEFAQIHTDLNKIRGQFGMLICRNIKKWSGIKKKQDHMLKDEKYVLVLEDSDIERMVKWKLKGNEEEIDDYLEDKFKTLID